jgi:hypothetical protein
MKPKYAEFAAPVALEGDEPRRFSGVAYSGGVATPAYWGPSVVDLASTAIAAPLPLLFRHDHDRLSVGVVTTVQNDGRQVTDEGELHTDLDDEGGMLANGIAARAKKGEPWQQSLGLYDFSEENVPPQKTVEVNGRTFQGPLTVMRGGTVREITFAPLGADPMTSAAVYAAATTEQQMPEIDPKVAELTAELNGMRPKLNDVQQQVATLTAERDALKAKLAASDARLAEMRTGAVKALFTECGLEATDAKVAAYADMSQEVFDTVAANLRTAHAGPDAEADPALFQHQATGDPDTPPAGKVQPRKLRPVSQLYAHTAFAARQDD